MPNSHHPGSVCEALLERSRKSFFDLDTFQIKIDITVNNTANANADGFKKIAVFPSSLGKD